MFAFLKTNEQLVKVYLDGRDWLVIGPDGDQRWFSTWHADPQGSLERAVSEFCHETGIAATVSDVQVTGSFSSIGA